MRSLHRAQQRCCLDSPGVDLLLRSWRRFSLALAPLLPSVMSCAIKSCNSAGCEIGSCESSFEAPSSCENGVCPVRARGGEPCGKCMRVCRLLMRSPHVGCLVRHFDLSIPAQVGRDPRSYWTNAPVSPRCPPVSFGVWPLTICSLPSFLSALLHAPCLPPPTCLACTLYRTPHPRS